VAALIHVMCFLLQVRLNGVATFIGKVGLSVAILVFIIQFIRCVSLSHSVCDVLSKSQVEQMQPPIFGSCWSGHIGGPRMGMGFLSVFFPYFQL
jgi:hypothetical protein